MNIKFTYIIIINININIKIIMINFVIINIIFCCYLLDLFSGDWDLVRAPNVLQLNLNFHHRWRKFWTFRRMIQGWNEDCFLGTL